MNMKNETIVDRVVERLKAQPIGDLITEEDLHDIVKDAIPKVFFERRKVTVRSGGYNSEDKEIEPAIIEVMRDLLQASAKEALKAWMIENTELIAEHWTKVIDAGLLNYVQQLQNEAATAQVKSALLGLMQKLNDERQKSGLMPIYW